MAIERLTADDLLMLRGDAAWPQDIGALVFLDGAALLDAAGGLRMDAVQEAIGARLHLVPRFRQRLHLPGRGLGGPLWVDDGDFALGNHLHVVGLPAPGGERDVLRAIEQIRRRRLDPSRPLWELWFLSGLPDRRLGLFVRIHHAVADGTAAMTTIGALLDPAPDHRAASPQRWTPSPAPMGSELVADSLRRRLRTLRGTVAALARPRAAASRVRAVLPAARELFAGDPGPETSLNRLIGPDRTLALVRTTVDHVREVGRPSSATVNDVLLALLAGGLRALLRNRDEVVDELVLPVYVPVSLRQPRAGGSAQGNLVTQMVVPLPIGEPDPTRRLRRIAAETATRKARPRSRLGTVFRNGIVSALLLRAIVRLRVNVTTANVRGPAQPLYLAGARVLEVFPVLPLIGNVTLGVGAVSYAGTLCIGVVGDRDAFPDLDVFADAMRAELGALRRPEAPEGEASRVTAATPAGSPSAPPQPARGAAPCR